MKRKEKLIPSNSTSDLSLKNQTTSKKSDCRNNDHHDENYNRDESNERFEQSFGRTVVLGFWNSVDTNNLCFTFSNHNEITLGPDTFCEISFERSARLFVAFKLVDTPNMIKRCIFSFPKLKKPSCPNCQINRVNCTWPSIKFLSKKKKVF